MRLAFVHDWPQDPGLAAALQERLKEKQVIARLPAKIRLVAGADTSYRRSLQPGVPAVAVAAIVVLSFPELQLVEVTCRATAAPFPYVPGLLTFREGPALVRAFEELTHIPDVILFDGQGLAHPKGMGIAAHMGILIDLPTIGCAKSRLCGIHDPVPATKGSSVVLRHGQAIIGAVVRTRAGVKPVYVSPGHRADIEGSVALTLDLCRRFRLPEPIRLAHQAAGRFCPNPDETG
ncbi:MAG: endonuclease V [Deltaproteobacteria bacterium]|nr:endonuclease V [Deltaproteobacteria bacterium]